MNRFKRLLAMFGKSLNKEIKISKHKNVYEICKGNNIIKIANRNSVYILDIIEHFDFYFNTVEPERCGNNNVVDYSKRSHKKVIGFDLHKIIFPSVSEPVITTKQYIDFAKLNETSIVLDLGAYSGLTSILFDREITSSGKNLSASGRVIAVEPDIYNLSCCIQNIQNYKIVTGRNIEYLYAAVSDKSGYQTFFADGTMSSSKFLAFSLLRNAININVQTLTLSDIATQFELEKIDFIKCDIEGGEKYVFKDKNFFEKYSPKIIIESHCINGTLTTESVIADLKSVGYKSEIIKQLGGYEKLPLICCEK